MGDDHSPTVGELQEMCAQFAAAFPDLRLYRALSEGAAGDADVAGLLLAARPGQARPILLLAALHDLVLAHPGLPAARWYPSVTGAPVPDGDPWPDVRAAALAHADRLREVIATRATQTNEVNRAVYLGALLARAAADVPDTPVVLLEMGASAGLLLDLDRYRIEVGVPGTPGAVVLGDPSSRVVCRGELLRGSAEGLALPRIVERVGLDLDPVDADDAAELRWLEACLWPDQPERLERFRGAVAALRTARPRLVRGDMIGDLADTARGAVHRAESPLRGIQPEAGGARSAHLVVVSSWALTYTPAERRPEVAAALAALARDGRPVSWLTAEPHGCAPGLPEVDLDSRAAEAANPETVLGARRWRDGRELPAEIVGWGHPHGAWLHLTSGTSPH